jgi:molybdopterin/thiamine biosynthesis adenylyltransferase
MGTHFVKPEQMQKIHGKTIALAGLGSVGSSVAVMSAREGIDLRLIDMGRVEEEDMHKLALFQEEDITKFKVKQAKGRLAAINPKVQVKSFHEELIASNIFLLQGDVVIDTTNSDEINKLILAHVTKKKYPLVLVRNSGSVFRILVLTKNPPAKILEKVSLPSTDRSGSFGPATTIAGSLAVAEAMRIMLGEKNNHILEFDTWNFKLKITKL